MNDPTRYQCYLIRFQRHREQDHWRVTLQAVHSAETVRFATEQEFVRVLLDALWTPSAPDKPSDDEPLI